MTDKRIPGRNGPEPVHLRPEPPASPPSCADIGQERAGKSSVVSRTRNPGATCGTCPYSDPFADYRVCRLGPPSRSDYDFLWPRVHELDWCRELPDFWLEEDDPIEMGSDGSSLPGVAGCTCGGTRKKNPFLVAASYPPQEIWTCEKCGNSVATSRIAR